MHGNIKQRKSNESTNCAVINQIFDLQRKGELSNELFKKAATALVNVGRVAEARNLVMLRPKYSYKQMEYADKLISVPFAERALVTCEELGCTKELFAECLPTKRGDVPDPGKCHPEQKLRYSGAEMQKMGLAIKDPKTDQWIFRPGSFKEGLFIEEVLKNFQIAYDSKEDVFYLFMGGCWKKQEKSASSTLRVQLMNLFDRLVPLYVWTPAIEQKYLARLANRCKRVDELITPPEYLINAKNGIIDWSEEEIKLLPHDPAYFFRYNIGIKYKPDAECPAFDKFMAEITKNDETMKMLLLEWLGYSLTNCVRAEKALIAFGTAANGKSTFLRVMRNLAGGNSGVSDVPLKDILSYRFGLFNVVDKNLNIDSDIISINDADFGTLKQIVSGENVNAEGKGKNQFSVRLTAKLVFACNEPPLVRCADIEALRRRICFVPFEQTFSEDPTGDELPLDNKLPDALEEELPGILNKAIKALRRLAENDYKFTKCRRADKALKAFLRDCNPVNSYVKERLAAEEGSVINNTVLKDDFCEWAKAEGYEEYTRLSFQKFKPLLRAALRFNKYPFKDVRGADNTRCTGGVAFKKVNKRKNGRR